MAKDRIIIRNFGPIQEVDIELPDIIVFIGQQAAGKSTIAKLIYLFRAAKDGTPSVINDLSEIFKIFFGETWLKQSPDAEIKYICGDGMKFAFKNNKLIYPELIRKQRCSVLYRELTRVQRRSVFIPAGRAVYSLVSNAMFGLSLGSVNIDPSILLFGQAIESIKSHKDPFETDPYLRDLGNEILKGKFRFVRNEDRIYFSDDKYITIDKASSGQQEAFPVLLFLAHALGTGGDHCITIEEPEAHLYPYAQHKLVEFITRVYNSQNASNMFVITTHSPYILTSFNNLLFAHQVAEISDNAEKAVETVIPVLSRVNPQDFAAYYVERGKVRSVFEDGLISDNEIDDASEDIAEIFDRLIDIYKGFKNG